jgi:shikimate kinase
MRIQNPAVVNKTYPTFWESIEQLGIKVERSMSSKKVSSATSQKTDRKIVLIGFMGSGKSSVAKALATHLNVARIEMDERVVRHSGQASITHIFETLGEATFRELEMSVAKSMVEETGTLIISTGGGVVMNTLTMNYLTQNNAELIYLETPWALIEERLVNQAERPLFKTPAEAERLYRLRLPLYRHYAHHIVNTAGQTPEALAQHIAATCGITAVATRIPVLESV